MKSMQSERLVKLKFKARASSFASMCVHTTRIELLYLLLDQEANNHDSQIEWIYLLLYQEE